jgi:hypothetical protein
MYTATGRARTCKKLHQAGCVHQHAVPPSAVSHIFNVLVRGRGLRVQLVLRQLSQPVANHGRRKGGTAVLSVARHQKQLRRQNEATLLLFCVFVWDMVLWLARLIAKC